MADRGETLEELERGRVYLLLGRTEAAARAFDAGLSFWPGKADPNSSDARFDTAAPGKITKPTPGEVPVKEQVAVLAKNGYKGFYCFEWEKKWHPEIEEPEVAFPHYAKTMAEYLAAAGYEA